MLATVVAQPNYVHKVADSNNLQHEVYSVTRMALIFELTSI
jgi:hypothetical protein